MNKIIRVELYVDNKREGLIQLECRKDYVKIIKDWLDRQIDYSEERGEIK